MPSEPPVSETPAPRSLHPLVAAAAEGNLPDWAVAGEERRAHMTRVARLLERWGLELGLAKDQVARWRAAGHLHDALRDAPPQRLAGTLSRRFRHLPPRAYHGPAAAGLLRREGVRDRELLHAIRWHTLGSRKFRMLGKALCAADALEPGRPRRRAWRKELRSRFTSEVDEVLTEILLHRIDYLLRARQSVHPRTLGFWNSLVNGS